MKKKLINNTVLVETLNSIKRTNHSVDTDKIVKSILRDVYDLNIQTDDYEVIMDEFKKENGSYICRDLLECDISTPEGVKYAKDNNLFTEFCPKMVESAAKITNEILSSD